MAALDLIQAPRFRDTFELCRATFAKAETRAGDEVLHRARNKNFSGLSLLCHSGSDVYRDSADLAVHDLAFTGVQTGADLESELAHALGDRASATNGARGPVEPCEEAVTGDVEFRAPETDELAGGQDFASPLATPLRRDLEPPASVHDDAPSWHRQRLRGLDHLDGTTSSPVLTDGLAHARPAESPSWRSHSRQEPFTLLGLTWELSLFGGNATRRSE